MKTGFREAFRVRRASAEIVPRAAMNVDEGDGSHTRRRVFSDAALVGAGAAVAFAVRPAVASAADFRVQVYTRDLPTTEDPTRVDSTAIHVFEQTRGGVVRGDPVWVIRDLSMADPYKDQLYVTDNGALMTGRYIVVSEKRYNAFGGDPANGAFIQGVSSLPDGSEASMVSASVDVDGPAFAGEAWTGDLPGQKNMSAFAAYDLDSPNGGRTSYSPGYGRKKFAIRGNGGLWWGANLANDLWANSDVRLERQQSGALRLSAPQARTPALMNIDAFESSQALRFSQGGKRRAEFVCTVNGHLYLDVGTGTPLRMYKDWSGVSVGGHDINQYRSATLTVQALRPGAGALELRAAGAGMTADLMRVTDYEATTTYSGVDRNGAFFDWVKSDAQGPPTTGTWNTGSRVLNTVDQRMYWCVGSGTPGTWRSVALQ